MPPITCAKCRGFQASEGDSWCVGCTACKALGRELTAHWENSGARRLGNDVVVSATRQLRALRSLSAGLAREGSGATAGTPRARTPEPPPAVPEPRSPPKRREREELPRRRGEEGRGSAKEEQHTEDCSEESEEEEDQVERSPPRDADHRPIREERPPTPPPPPEKSYPGTRNLPVKLTRRDRSQERDRSRDRRRRSSHHSGKRRGGRKHKRLHRLAQQPDLLIHRVPGRSFWELSAEQPGSLELAQLGR